MLNLLSNALKFTFEGGIEAARVEEATSLRCDSGAART